MYKDIKMGDLVIKGNIFLAPMAGITNSVYRLNAKKMGASLTYSEMISDKGLTYKNKKTLKMIQASNKERPLALQLFGWDINSLLDAVEIINNQKDVAFIDINMGCPANKVIKAKAGSYWLTKEDEAIEKIEKIVKASKKPVSIKLRLGWDENSINVLSLAKKAEEVGVSLICIHGRTRSQFYSGNARYEEIKKVKEEVKIPVIANGDIDSYKRALEVLEYTKCDGIMVGRASLGNPWIFKEIKKGFLNKKYKKPSIKQKIKFSLKHAKDLIKLKGEKLAIMEMRNHFCWYLKGEKNTNETKKLINLTTTYKEVKNILNNYIKENKNG